MRRLIAALAVALIAAVCSRPPEPPMDGLSFLTRDGCVNTAVMRDRLDDALAGLGLPPDYRVIDLGTLPVTDRRTGYPTPTVLYRGMDVFGFPEPQPPYAQPG